jgi:undecaprenyl pyrophosphate phosphatase UppP
MLFVTAVLLTLSEVLSKKTRETSELTWLDSLIIGLFQALSIFPGFPVPAPPFLAAFSAGSSVRMPRASLFYSQSRL